MYGLIFGVKYFVSKFRKTNLTAPINWNFEIAFHRRFKTNRFHFFVLLYCNRSQKTSLRAKKRIIFLFTARHDVLYDLLERFRFRFQYLHRYLNLSFSQSDVSDLPD